MGCGLDFYRCFMDGHNPGALNEQNTTDIPVVVGDVIPIKDCGQDQAVGV